MLRAFAVRTDDATATTAAASLRERHERAVLGMAEWPSSPMLTLVRQSSAYTA
jgi:SHS2 domain-containing protein